MLPIYRYSPLKVVHFDMDKNLAEIEEYLNVPNQLRIIHSDLLPKYLIYEMLDDPLECKVDIRFTFRIYDKEETLSFGSYVSEQFFYIKYVNDEHTKSQVKHLFHNSHFSSEQEFDKLRDNAGLPKGIRFTYYTFPDSVIEELFQILKNRAQPL